MPDARPMLTAAEIASLRQLSAGRPPTSVPQEHVVQLQRLMLIERSASACRLTPLGELQLRSLRKAAPIAAGDPIKWFEGIVWRAMHNGGRQ